MGSISKEYLMSIFRLQKHAIRIIKSVPIRTGSALVFQSLEFISGISCIWNMHKYVHNWAPYENLWVLNTEFNLLWCWCFCCIDTFESHMNMELLSHGFSFCWKSMLYFAVLKLMTLSLNLFENGFFEIYGLYVLDNKTVSNWNWIDSFTTGCCSRRLGCSK